MLKLLVALVLALTSFGGVAFAEISENAFDVNAVDLPNFQIVIQKQVYRGGAPTPQGVRNLAAGGIKTIVDLRNEDPQGSANEKALASTLGMKYYYVPLSPFLTPSDQTMSGIESNLLADPNLRPIFVHCHYGEDRTGLVIGLFRVFKQNPAFAPAQAYNEMLTYGFHPQLQNLADYFFAKTGWRP